MSHLPDTVTPAPTPFLDWREEHLRTLLDQVRPVVDVDLARLDDAFMLVRYAHGTQVDKIGHPYVGHVCRVAARVAVQPGARLSQVLVALLHDVVEDSDVTADDLHRLGFPAPVVQGVLALTRRKDVPAEVYYARLAADPAVRPVKQADLADNTHPPRVALLPAASRPGLDRKYAHAVVALAGDSGVDDLDALQAVFALPGPDGHVCDTGHFDRTMCPEPCGSMHSFCGGCGRRQDRCRHDD